VACCGCGCRAFCLPVARQSDRWVTPGVVIVALLGLLTLALATIGGVAWLVAIGRDPAPLLQGLGAVVASLSSLGALGLQLANRSTVTKVERNTSGLAPGGVPVRFDATEPIRGLHGRPRVPRAQDGPGATLGE
jgi:hypothetical protein